jgi:CDP-diacylglycerol---serine O-phosphatidyltransferase
VLPAFVGVVIFIALLIGYPWYVLSAGTVLYLLSLPWGWKSYRDQARKFAATHAAEAGAAPASAAPGFTPAVSDTARDDRPDRLH